MAAVLTARDVNNSELGKEVQFKLKDPPLLDNGIASARDRVGLHICTLPN